jgi:exodeoxyribonuclease VII large subunit
VKKRGPESQRIKPRNKFHAFFRDQAVPVLAKVIHRAARFQHLQRLVAFRAAGLKGKYPFALGAMRAAAFDI